MLVSVHLPKTAGTSFRQLLESFFGERLLVDYADRPLHSAIASRRLRALRGAVSRNLRPDRLREVDAVHGHFLAIKYVRWRGAGQYRRVTWLRDPVERLASHYHYWRRTFDPSSAGGLHRRVVEENWSLEAFCLSPELRNIYRQFLWGVPLARFDFVGITEHFATDIDDFARDLLAPGVLQAHHAPEALNGNPGARSVYVTDADFRLRIERFHAADVRLYQEALTLRRRRLKAGH